VYNKRTGDVGENIACMFLEQHGYRILHTKYKVSWCEIDIIAEKYGVMRFVEVKSVSGVEQSYLYRPEELVHARKLNKIIRFADYYMNQEKNTRDYQVDVVAVFLNHLTRTARCRLLENVSPEYT
jgi:putative endonuclease